jgi:uncharacterized protein (DUF58 family)
MNSQNQTTIHKLKFPIPTIRTIWLMGLGIPLAMVMTWRWAMLLDVCILTLYVLDYFFTLRHLKINAQRNIPSRLSQGTPLDIQIVMANMGNRALPVQIRDQTPLTWGAAPVLKGVAPGRSESELSYGVIPPERGVYTFGDLFMRVKGPFGFVLRSLRLDLSEEVKVYSNLESLKYQDLATYRRMNLSSGLRQSPWREGGREFDSLREYTEGDDLRKIDWKASARLDRPIVREFQPEKNQIIMILIDAGRLMSAVTEGKTKLDHALDATAQLVHTALSAGDQAGFIAFTDRVITFIPPKRRSEQLHMIMEQALQLGPDMVDSKYEEAFLLFRSRIRRRSLVVLFTDLLDDLTSEKLLDAIGLLRPRHLPLCIAIRESEWDALLTRPPSVVEEVYERSVLHESLLQRKKALRNLLQKGALAMDLPPSRLSLGTIERYLEVKRKGLL